MQSSKQSARIDELDGLRGVLALWVAVSHIFCWCGFTALPPCVPGTIKRFWVEVVFAQGAVDTFIILSGFVISYLIHTNKQSYKLFMTGRFFRIYPVYLVCLLFGFSTIFLVPFILNHAGWQETIYFQWETLTSTNELARPIAHLIAHLTLLFGVIPDKLLPHTDVALLTPAWSISLEWQYYLLAPLIAYAVRSRTGILMLGVVGCSNTLYAHFWGNAFLPVKLPFFLIGIGSYHLYANYELWKKYKNTTFIVLAILAGIMAIAWHWLALTIWTLVFGCLFANQEDFYSRCLKKLRRILLLPGMQFIGKISYPLYLVHWPIILVFMFWLLHWHPNITANHAVLFMLCVCLPIILLTAFLLHKLIELPMMKVGKRFKKQNS